MHAAAFLESINPIAYADQKRRKVFVMSEDRMHLIPPSAVSIEDKVGNQIMVPIDLHGDMTVMDVSNLNAGSYVVRIAGLLSKSIRVILF